MEDSLGSSDSEKELKHELLDAGIRLLTPSSTDELLKLLDKVEEILSQVGQDPSRSMQDALVPSMKALISNELLRHPLMDVKVSVVSCISEILRITAPFQPYDDEKMKEIFELTVMAFEMLSHLSGHGYSKALQILETVAKVRSCVVLLDLGYDTLILQIFRLFFDTIRFDHPPSVFSNMEDIMTWLIDESDDLSLELLKTLLASVRKEKQAISPLSWKLGEEVLRCCSTKVKPYLSKAVKLMRINFDDYSEIVTSLCQDDPSVANLVAEDVKPSAFHLKEIDLSATSRCKPLPDDITTQKKNKNAIILKIQNSSKTLQSDNQLEPLKNMIHQVAETVKPSAFHLKEVGISATSPCKPLPDDITTQKKNENCIILKIQNSSKTLQSDNQLEQLKSTEEKSSLKPEAVLNGEDLEVKADGGGIPRRRGRKPNSLMKPEEGYEHSWTVRENNSLEAPHERKNHQTVVNLEKNSSPKESSKTLHVDIVNCPNIQDQSGNDTSRRRKGRPKKESPIKVVLALGQVRENGESNLGVELTVGSGNAKDAEDKPRRGSRRKKCSTKSDREEITASSMVVPKKENDVLSDSEVTPNILDGHTDETKAMGEKASHRKRKTKEIAPSPVSKSLSQDENLSATIVNSKRRRNRDLQEEEGSKRATFVKDYGEELVGSKIKVWWPLDRKFYDGVIMSFSPSTKKHQITYVDGDEETLNLNKERWILLDDVPENQDENATLPTSAITPAKSERTKAKRMITPKTKQDNSSSSAKTKRSKSAPRKRGSKSAESSSAETLYAEKSENAKTDTGDEEKDDK